MGPSHWKLGVTFTPDPPRSQEGRLQALSNLRDFVLRRRDDRSHPGLGSIARQLIRNEVPVRGVQHGVEEKRQLVECDPDVIEHIQRLVDASVRVKWTRDRGKANKVPCGYEVVRVARNENVRLWLKYCIKKSLVVEGIESLNEEHRVAGKPPIRNYEVLTTQAARTMPESLRTDETINEWYLWHGASSTGALGIAEQEFKQLYAGSTTGTLYGRGTYLSDSCTKADEYSVEIPEGPNVGLHCFLLCRTLGGNVNYNIDVTPRAADLEKSVFEGCYDSVLGDREKCRDTFKEIVIYDSSQAYPEYIVYYKRKYVEAEP